MYIMTTMLCVNELYLVVFVTLLFYNFPVTTYQLCSHFMQFIFLYVTTDSLIWMVQNVVWKARHSTFVRLDFKGQNLLSKSITYQSSSIILDC